MVAQAHEIAANQSVSSYEAPIQQSFPTSACYV